MLAGNLLALFQNNLKRLLAYSSIAHMGYLLLPILSGSTTAVHSVAFYLAAYSVSSLGAFGVLSVLSTSLEDAGSLDALSGLAWRRPWLTGVLSLMLLSLAGLPLTAGFFGKFYLLAAGAEAGFWTLSIILVVSSAIGLFYYLRVIIGLFASGNEAADVLPSAPHVPVLGGIVLGVLTVALVLIGVYPAPLIRLIEAALFAA